MHARWQPPESSTEWLLFTQACQLSRSPEEEDNREETMISDQIREECTERPDIHGLARS